MQVSLELAEEEKEYWKETMTYIWHEFEDEDLKRMFKKYAVLGTSALPEDLNHRLIQAINNMKSTYAKATICDYSNRTKCDLHVEPGKMIILYDGNRKKKNVRIVWSSHYSFVKTVANYEKNQH